MTAEDEARRTRIRVLSAVQVAMDDPLRLVTAVADAEDDEEAARRVGEAYGLDADQSRVLLDLQVGRLSRASRARVADELRVLRAEWGPPIEATLRITGRRRGVLSVEGREHHFRATGRQDLLGQVHAFLHEQVARPQLRTVRLVDIEAADGPARWTVRPDGSGSPGQADD